MSLTLFVIIRIANIGNSMSANYEVNDIPFYAVS